MRVGGGERERGARVTRLVSESWLGIPREVRTLEGIARLKGGGKTRKEKSRTLIKVSCRRLEDPGGGWFRREKIWESNQFHEECWPSLHKMPKGQKKKTHYNPHRTGPERKRSYLPINRSPNTLETQRTPHSPKPKNTPLTTQAPHITPKTNPKHPPPKQTKTHTPQSSTAVREKKQ